jgi:cation transport ATPase
MADQIPNSDKSTPSEPPPAGQTPPPPPMDWRAQRHAERMKRREERWNRRDERWRRYGGRPYVWFIGALLIVIGAILLLETMGYQTFLNWWALLILIPAFWAYMAAWNIYQDNDRVTAGVLGSIAVGILLTILTGIFLFNLEPGVFWPFLIIITGLFLVVTALFPRQTR